MGRGTGQTANRDAQLRNEIPAEQAAVAFEWMELIEDELGIAAAGADPGDDSAAQMLARLQVLERRTQQGRALSYDDRLFLSEVADQLTKGEDPRRPAGRGTWRTLAARDMQKLAPSGPLQRPRPADSQLLYGSR